MLLVQTRLAVSRIHGIGLFADERILHGTVIWRFNPVFDLRFSDTDLESLSEESREQIVKYSYREISSRLYVLCSDDARFFNHSDNPNCVDRQGGLDGDVTIARIDIEIGEELTCDYSLFDRDLVEGRYSLPGRYESPRQQNRQDLPPVTDQKSSK